VQFLSLGLVIGFVLIACLVIALAILASPIFAAIVFVVAFGAFLVWRGSRRAKIERGAGRRQRVPSTQEAAADPVADSGPAAARPKRGT
jgi:hypothetical protein